MKTPKDAENSGQNPSPISGRNISHADATTQSIHRAAIGALSHTSEAAEVPNKPIRVYLVRHYPYQDAGKREVYQHLEDIPEDSRNQLKDAYDGIFVNPSRVLFLYDKTDGLPRVISTAQDLIRRYAIPQSNIDDTIHLPGSSDSSGEASLERKIRTLEELRVLTREKLKSTDFRNVDTIVIIGNRTYVEPFDLFAGGKKDLTQDKLTSKGYLYRDFTSQLEPSLPKITSLQIPPRLFQDFQQLFPEIQSTSCQELQTQIQQFFELDEAQFRAQLFKPLLTSFCLANLLSRPSRENDEILQKYLYSLRQNKKPIPIEILEIFLKQAPESSLTKEAILWSIIFSDEQGLHNIENLCKTLKLTELYDALRKISQRLKTFDATASVIFETSLDTLVKKREFIPRRVFKYQKKTEAELNKSQEDGVASKEDEYTKQTLSLDSIVGATGPQVLLGNVGEGKSTELARMKEQIDTNTHYTDILTFFYSGKVNNEQSILEQIERDISDIRVQFPGKKLVIFFDGIDELDGNIRDTIVTGLKSLHADSVRVILGSRPIGFDRYENSGFETIHFSKIPQEERNQFLRSRLEYLGVSEDEKEKKLGEILSFLARPILSDELKDTPLILYFLTRLCISGKLQNIRNRAELYEEITKLILIEHQKKKGLDFTEHWSTSILLDTLSYCAYALHTHQKIQREDIVGHLGNKIRGNVGLGDEEATVEAMADQIFLLYQLEGGEYHFILKSFEEYFLARYIQQANTPSKDSTYPNATEGESLIYQMRDNNTKSWNNWRNFRPVVLFYGEMLGNTGDTAGLVRLLGDEGLLQNDDMFGEGFFMGLEILYNLPESVRKHPAISSIWQRYEHEVSGWNIGDILKRIESIREFSKKLGFRDTIISERILEFLEEKGVNKLYTTIAGIFSPTIITYTLNYIQAKLLHGVNLHFPLELVYSFVTNGNHEGVRAAIEGAGWLEGRGQNQDARSLYWAIAQSGNHEGFQISINKAKSLEVRGRYIEASSIYCCVAISGTHEGVKAAIKGAKRLAAKGIYKEVESVYKYLVKSGTHEGVKAAIKGAKWLVDRGRFKEASSLNRSLVGFGTHEGVKAAIQFAKRLETQGEYALVTSFYCFLVSYGTHEGIQAAIQFAKRLETQGKYEESKSLYKSIVLSGNHEGVEAAIQFAKRLETQGNDSVATSLYSFLIISGNQDGIQSSIIYAKSLETQEKYAETKLIYHSLIRSGNHEGVEAAIKLAKRLETLGNYAEAVSVYNLFIGSGNHEGVEAAIKLAKSLEVRGRYIEASSIYCGVAISGTHEGTQAAIQFAKRLETQGKYEESKSLYKSIVLSGNQEGIQAAIKFAKMLQTQEEYVEASVVYDFLIRSGSHEGTQAAIKGAKWLAIRGQYKEATNLYRRLVKCGYQEGIQVAIEGADTFKLLGNYKSASDIYNALYTLPQKII